MLYIQNPKVPLKKFTLTSWKCDNCHLSKKLTEMTNVLVSFGQYTMVGEKYVYTIGEIETGSILSSTATKATYIGKIRKWNSKKRTMKNYFPNESIFWATLTYFSSGAMYWMKQLYIFKTTSSGNDVFFLMISFRLCPGSNCLLNTIVLVAKFFSQKHVSVGMLDFLYVSLKILYLVAMVTSTSNSFFVISKFSDYMQ